jgi:hypothetical protein
MGEIVKALKMPATELLEELRAERSMSLVDTIVSMPDRGTFSIGPATGCLDAIASSFTRSSL